MTLERLVGGKLGNRQHDPPDSLTPVPFPNPGSAHWEARRLQGSTGNWGSRNFVSPGRFSGFALCFSFQPQLVPGFIISKGDKAPDGRKLAGAQGAGPSALGASQQIVPWKQGSCP